MNETYLLSQKMKIPDNLDHLMRRLTQEILCHQPDNIYEFAANFCDQLIQERNGTSWKGLPVSESEPGLKPENLQPTDSTIAISAELPLEESHDYGEDLDDYDHELQRLGDEKLTSSPPPTLDESMSDHAGSPPLPIAATVTLKVLESPRSVVFSTVSRPTSGVAEGLPPSADDGNLDGQLEEETTENNALDEMPPEIAGEDEEPVAAEVENVQVDENPAPTEEEVEKTNEDGDLLVTEENQMEDDVLVNTEENPEETPTLADDNVEEESVQITTEDEIGATENEQETNEDEAVADASELEGAEVSTVVEDEVKDADLNGDEASDPATAVAEEAQESTADQEDLVAEETEENTGDHKISKREAIGDFDQADDMVEDENHAEDETNQAVDFEISQDTEGVEEPGATLEEPVEEAESTEVVGDDDNQLGTNVEADPAIEPSEEPDEVPAEDSQETPVEETNEPDAEVETLIVDEVEPAENAVVDEVEPVANAEEVTEDSGDLGEPPHDDELPVEGNLESEELVQEEAPAELENETEATGEETVLVDDHIDEVQDENPVEIETIDNEAAQEEQPPEIEVTEIDELAVENEDQEQVADEEVGEPQEEELVSLTGEENEVVSTIELAEENVDATESELVEDVPVETNETETNDVEGDTSHEVVDEPVVESYDSNPNEDTDAADDHGNNEETIIEEENHSVKDLEETLAEETETAENVESQIEGQEDQPVGDDVEPSTQLDQTANDENDPEVLNDDEEEIWRKLQKDIELEEEEQKILAATKIQSSFRGYKTRKELSEARQRSVQSGENDEFNNSVDVMTIENSDEVDDKEETIVEDGEAVTEEHGDNNEGEQVLPDTMEHVDPVDLLDSETPVVEPESIVEANTEVSACPEHETETESEIENLMAHHELPPELSSELNDVKEEPLSNGEEINDIQLINSYLISTDSIDQTNDVSENQVPTEDSNEDAGEDNQDKEDVADGAEIEVLADDSQNDQNDQNKEAEDEHVTENTDEAPTETSSEDATPNEKVPDEVEENKDDGEPTSENKNDQEEVFELYVKSDETTNDGLLDSCCQPQVVEPSHSQHQLSDLNEADAIDLTSDDTVVAATKIQAGYRGYRDRKLLKQNNCVRQTSEMSDRINTPTEDPVSRTRALEEEHAAATRIQANYKGYQERKRLKCVKQKQSAQDDTIHSVKPDSNKTNQSLEATDQENYAATKIQANYKGYQERKRLKSMKDKRTEGSAQENSTQSQSSCLKLDNEDIHRADQSFEASERENHAATKIQAGFRGHKDRKRVKNLKNPSPQPHDLTQQEILENPIASDELTSENIPVDSENFAEENHAATKIQANFRGNRDRKRMKGLKESKAENERRDLNAKHPEEQTDVTEHLKTDCTGANTGEFGGQDHENAAATKIQASYRGHRDRKKLKNLKSQQTTRPTISRDDTEGLNCKPWTSDERNAYFSEPAYLRCDSLPELEKTRPTYKLDKRRSDSTPVLHYESTQLSRIEKENAAIKIQSSFRGYLARSKTDKK